MKITIDREACIMCGSCENICDKVFHLPDNDKSTIVEKYRVSATLEKGEIPADLEACAQEAADNCPVSAITTEK
jgi:ferredoxin